MAGGAPATDASDTLAIGNGAAGAAAGVMTVDSDTLSGFAATDIIFANAAPVSSIHVQDFTSWHEATPALLPLQTWF